MAKFSHLLLVMASFLSGCGLEDEDANSSTEKVEIKGDWVSKCEEKTDNETSYKHSVEFDESSMTTRQYSFWELGCDEAMTLSENFQFEATFSKQNDVTTFIDLTVVHLKWTPRTEFFASLLNENTTCGFADWKSNESKNISGATCEGTVFPEAGDKRLGLYTVIDGELTVAYGTSRPSATNPVEVTDRFYKQ